MWGNFITGVKARLTNGKESLYYSTTGPQNYHTILSLKGEEITRVELKGKTSHKDANACFGIKFKKKTKNISIYTAKSKKSGGWEEYEIPKGESLIGIYGATHSDEPAILNFGLMTIKHK